MSQALRWMDVLAIGSLGGASLILVPGCSFDWIYPLCMRFHPGAVWFSFAAVGPVLTLLVVRGVDESAWQNWIARLSSMQGWGSAGGLLFGALWTGIGEQYLRRPLLRLCCVHDWRCVRGTPGSPPTPSGKRPPPIACAERCSGLAGFPSASCSSGPSSCIACGTSRWQALRLNKKRSRPEPFVA